MDEAIVPEERESLLRGIPVEARRRLAAAVTGAVLAGVGASFLLVPDDAPPPAVVRRAARPAATATVSDPRLKITVPPVLRTPFTAGHEMRPGQLPPPAGNGAAAKVPEKRPAAPRTAPPRPRLTGIVASGQRMMALIVRGGQTMALAPGESRGGVTLVEIRDGRVRVRDENGEYELCLPGREEATGR